MPINVMESAEYWLCDDLAFGLSSSNLKGCRIKGSTLTKRPMRTPTVEICDIQRNGSMRMALGEDKQMIEIDFTQRSEQLVRQFLVNIWA
jgi:hypothetical protein